MSLKVVNKEGFISGLKAVVLGKRKEIEDLRKSAAKELTLALMENIPVWSGRTISSIKWSNDGSMAPLEPHPGLGAFPSTNRLPLGQEPLRPQAEAKALSSLDAVSYSMKSKVYLTINSTAWDEVNTARAPDAGRARNRAVVIELARQRVRAKFRDVK